MASSYKEIPLTFEKGLVTEIEESILDSGQASELTNWEATPQGGLRARNAWESITTTGLSTPYKVRGFGAIAAGGSSSVAVGPQIVQTKRWPDGLSADQLNTKTHTLTGCTIGNVLVAVVAENSGETPTVTGGWTQRAIGAGNENFVKFYTKTAVSSTEAFTYTIVASRIRELTVYEIAYLDSEDPGSKWAADAINAGSGGSDTLTVNTTDSDGGIVITGYHYDGGTPATSGTGTSGYSGSTLDDSNSRTGVSIQDLDQLDVSLTDSAVDMVTSSWTPPATGIVLCTWWGVGTTAASLTAVTGNGLTWSTPTAFNGGTATNAMYYSWADCSLVTPTTGSITVDHAFNGPRAAVAQFWLLTGASTSAPVTDTAQGNVGSGASGGADVGTLGSSSALLGFANNTSSSNGDWTPETAADDFDSATPLDSISIFSNNSGFFYYQKIAKNENPASPSHSSPDWFNNSANTISTWVMELAGVGGASQARHGSYTGPGEAIEHFDHVANKNITAKVVAWGHTPGVIQSDIITFYITMAVANGTTGYKIYRVLRDEITSGTWEQIDAVTDATSNEAWVSFAQGAGQLVWTASTLTAPRVISLSTLLASNVTDLTGKSGRAAVYHKDRMFVAGATTTPSRVFFSDIGDPDEFVTTTDFLDIGGDDGEAIQDLLSVEGLLLVAKTNRAYLVSGSGVESFFVNELPGGTAATGRSAVRTPFGTILAGTDDIWVVQGGGVDPMSRPLGDGYRITGKASTAYGQDTVLVCDSGTNTLWRVNLVTGAWSYETVTGDDAANFMVWSLNGRLYYGTDDSDTQVGGTRQLLSARNVDETTGDTHFSGATGRLALDGPAFQYTPRYLYLQTRAQNTSLYNELHVTLTTNLNENAPYETSIPVTEATQRDRITMAWAKGAEWLKIGFRADSSDTASAIDVEKIVLGVDVEAPR